jgi:8-oxo-dGTP pyrophosphatase MutT (NUDIX family)
MKNRILAKTVIVDEVGKVLLLCRSKTDPRRPGEQDFPGGQVEPGEDMAMAAAREIHEEVGLIVDPRDLRLVYAATETYDADDTISVTRLLFVTRINSPLISLSPEHDAYEWCDVNTAAKLFPHPFYGGGLRYAAEHDLLQAQTYDTD